MNRSSSTSKSRRAARAKRAVLAKFPNAKTAMELKDAATAYRLEVQKERDALRAAPSRKAAEQVVDHATGQVAYASPPPSRDARAVALEKAALEFVRKVESGEARSRHSYAEFKAALALPQAKEKDS